MRHRIYGKQLNRTSAHRTAMLRNLAAGLFEHGQIETTLPKAKAVKGFAEKLITLAKTRSLHTRRQLERKINDRNIFAWADDPQVPDERKSDAFFEVPGEGEIKRNRYGDLKKSPRLVEHLLSKVAPMFEGRDGGYTKQVGDHVIVVPTVDPGHITPHSEAFQAVVWHGLVCHPDLMAKANKWEGLARS